MVPDALARALREAALVVVHAPAGYGKTTSVRAALANDAGVAWYDAEPWEAGAFATALIERVRAVRPDAGRITLALAERGAEPERLGATLAAELRHVDAPLRIVVDDAHVLGPSFAAFARSLAQRMPASVRLVLVARALLDAGLPEAVAAGRAAIVDVGALRFDVPRVRALARSLGVVMDDARATALVDRTGGWPIAIALALRADPSSGALLDELVARQLAALDAGDRALLARTCAFETIEPAVVAPHDADLARRLRALAGDGTLLSAVHGGFRVHPLVREGLLRDAGEARLRGMYAGAALAYARAGRLRPALFHLDRAGDADADAAFLREHAARAVASGLAGVTRAAIARVRAAPAADAALLALVDGLLAKARGDDGRSAFALAAREADARADGALAFEARLESIEADLAHGDPVEPARIDDLLARARAHGTAALAAATVRAGWADAVAGDFARALARLDAVASNDGDVAAEAGPLEAYAHLALGDFEASDRVANALVETLANGDDVVRYAGALGWAARFALLRGETHAAYELAREAERIARPFALRPQAAALHATLAEAALHAGDTAAARLEADAAQRTAGAAWYARDAQRARTLAARVVARADALDGDPARALAAAGEGDAPSLADAAAFAVLARARDAAARVERARRAIAEAVPADAADAVALWSAAEVLDALDALRGRTVRTPLRSGAFAGLIARRAAAAASGAEPGPRFETQLLARLAGPAPAATQPPHAGAEPPLEELTPREREILELLAGGLTNREIAQRLIVSPRTVETHVARITGKLGVSSRARAVARAVALRIVAPPAAAV
jgi:ATP/maltotriose-dependent transcriptional regulator MalT